MSTRRLSLTAAAMFAIGGPLLVVGLWAPVGPLAGIGVLLVWGGAGGVLAAMLLAAREQQRALRRVQRDLSRANKALRPAPSVVSSTELTGALAELREVLKAHQDATARELVQHLDTRVLGIQAMVRELAGQVDVDGATPVEWEA